MTSRQCSVSQTCISQLYVAGALTTIFYQHSTTSGHETHQKFPDKVMEKISKLIAFLYRSLEYTPEFTVWCDQYWQVTFHIPSFWCRPKGSRTGLYGTRWQLQNKKNESAWKCPENLHGNLCCASNCSKNHCAQMMISMEMPLSQQDVPKFWIPLDVFSTCRLPKCLILQYQTTSFWGYMKNQVYKTHPANTDDLKQWIQECIQGTHKEMLCVMTSFPLQMQKCVERQGGHI